MTLGSMWPTEKPPSKILVSKINDIFESPAPLTSAIPGRPSIASLTLSLSSSSTPTTTSRSPIVSLRLRALPASWAFITPSIEAIFCSNASPYFRPTSNRRRARNLANSSIPSSIFCCDFAPNPFSPAMASSSAACFSVAIESTPNSSFMILIRLGPRPGMPNISIRPGGVLLCKSTQSLGQRPSPTACEIAEPSPLPMPLISNICPVATSSPKSSVMPPSVLLAFW